MLNDWNANDVNEGQIRIVIPESTTAALLMPRSAILGKGESESIFVTSPSLRIHFRLGL